MAANRAAWRALDKADPIPKYLGPEHRKRRGDPARRELSSLAYPKQRSKAKLSFGLCSRGWSAGDNCPQHELGRLFQGVGLRSG